MNAAAASKIQNPTDDFLGVGGGGGGGSASFIPSPIIRYLSIVLGAPEAIPSVRAVGVSAEVGPKTTAQGVGECRRSCHAGRSH